MYNKNNNIKIQTDWKRLHANISTLITYDVTGINATDTIGPSPSAAPAPARGRDTPDAHLKWEARGERRVKRQTKSYGVCV